MRGERRGSEGTHKPDSNGWGNKITIGKLRNAKKGKSAPRRSEAMHKVEGNEIGTQIVTIKKRFIKRYEAELKNS